MKNKKKLIELEEQWCVHYDGVLSLCQVSSEEGVYDEDMLFSSYQEAVSYVSEEYPAWARFLGLIDMKTELDSIATWIAIDITGKEIYGLIGSKRILEFKTREYAHLVQICIR